MPEFYYFFAGFMTCYAAVSFGRKDCGWAWASVLSAAGGIALGIIYGAGVL